MISGLKDQSLFRQQCYIDGGWVGADSGKVVEVNNPATQEVIGTIPKLVADETAGRSKRRTRRGPPGGRGPPRSGPRSCGAGTS